MCVYIYTSLSLSLSLSVSIYIYIYIYIHVYIYIYIYIHTYIEREGDTHILEFRGFDSSIVSRFRVGILMSVGNFPVNNIRLLSIATPYNALWSSKRARNIL